MITLHEARQNLGRGVIFSNAGGIYEHGTIERVTVDYVMVRYAKGGVKATRAIHLSFKGTRAGDERNEALQ